MLSSRYQVTQMNRKEEIAVDAAIYVTGKKVAKVLGAVCLATGVVALGAVLASGAAAGTMAQGFKSAKNTMREILRKGE